MCKRGLIEMNLLKNVKNDVIGRTEWDNVIIGP